MACCSYGKNSQILGQLTSKSQLGTRGHFLLTVFFPPLCFIFNVMTIHGIYYAPRESLVQHNFLWLFLRLEIISNPGLLHRICSCFNNRRWCSWSACSVLSTVLSDWCVLNHSLLEQLHEVGIVIFVIYSRGTWSAERLINVPKAVQLWDMSPGTFVLEPLLFITMQFTASL